MASETCAIVVTYNRVELLKEAIEALKNSSVTTDILIVDNASSDGTEDVCKKIIETNNSPAQIIYHNTGGNYGGAGGFNIGLRKAYELGYKYYWLMDDDTIVTPDALSELFKASEYLNGEWGFLSSNAYFTDGKVAMMNGYSIARKWHYERQTIEHGIVMVERATFVGFLTTRKVIEEFGLPVWQYFIWGDDTEFSLRVARKLPCYFVSTSKVIHKMKTNENTLNLHLMNDKGRVKRMELSIRNDGCTYRRLGFIDFAFHTARAMKLFGQAVKSKQMKGLKMGVVIKGYFKGMFFHPKIEYVNDPGSCGRAGA